MYTSALDIRGMSRVTAVSPPVHSKRGWAGKKQWQVFIIQFITTLTIIFKCICKLCSLLFCQFKQIKIIFAQIVINIIVRELITLEEIKAYYGLLIMKDILQLDRDAHYWYTGAEYILLSTKFGGVMSRDQFFQIRRYLYFVDPKKDVSHGDKFHKIRYILDTVRQSFKDEYIPHKEVTVDEAMVPFKGRLCFKQFMKDKPVKFGIKLWVCADAVTAYCYNLEVYTGKHGGQINKLMGLSARVLIGLTKPIHNFGHIVFTDNFYTSPVLAKYLAGKDTYLCRTARPNRIGYPVDLIKTKTEIRWLPRGASEWWQCEGMVATAWKDKKMVHYLSSAHAPEWAPNTPSVTTQCRQKDGTVIELQCPPSVAAYAKFMNGVDRLDQNTRQNKSKKSMKWYRWVETKLMETSIYNAYVIEGDTVSHKVDCKSKRDFLSFELDLAHQLVGDHCQERPQTGGRPRSAVTNTASRLDRTDHWPVAGVGKDHTCVVCSARHKRYKDTHATCWSELRWQPKQGQQDNNDVWKVQSIPVL